MKENETGYEKVYGEGNEVLDKPDPITQKIGSIGLW